jgi:hypothetical protein
MRTEIIDYNEIEFEVEYTFIEGDFSTGLVDSFNIENIYIHDTEVLEVLSEKTIEYLTNELAQRC